MSTLESTVQAIRDTAEREIKKLMDAEKGKAWPQPGGRVYICDQEGAAHDTVYDQFLWGGELSQGNIFPTEAEAETESLRRAATTKVLARIKELNGDWGCDFSDTDQIKFSFDYNHITEAVRVDYDYSLQRLPSTHYFPPHIKGQLLSELAPEILLMLGVKK